MYNKNYLVIILLIFGLNLMAMTKKEKQTITFYDKQAEKFIGSSGVDDTPSFWDTEIKGFQKLLTTGRILDIGVGKGREAKRFIDANYKYVGIEPATGLRENLAKQFPNQTFIGDTIYDWDLSPNSFDGFWCSAMLLHVPRENIDQALQQIKKVMKPGAVGFISLAAGDGEYFDEDTGRYFYLYDQDKFARILERNGFIIEKRDFRKQDTYRHWLRNWLTYFVRVKK